MKNESSSHRHQPNKIICDNTRLISLNLIKKF